MRKYISIIFINGRNPIRLRMIKRDFRSLWYWLERSRYDWTAINVYDKNTHAFVIQLRMNNYWTKIQSL